MQVRGCLTLMACMTSTCGSQDTSLACTSPTSETLRGVASCWPAAGSAALAGRPTANSTKQPNGLTTTTAEGVGEGGGCRVAAGLQLALQACRLAWTAGQLRRKRSLRSAHQRAAPNAALLAPVASTTSPSCLAAARSSSSVGGAARGPGCDMAARSAQAQKGGSHGKRVWNAATRIGRSPPMLAACTAAPALSISGSGSTLPRT